MPIEKLICFYLLNLQRVIRSELLHASNVIVVMRIYIIFINL